MAAEPISHDELEQLALDYNEVTGKLKDRLKALHDFNDKYRSNPVDSELTSAHKGHFDVILALETDDPAFVPFTDKDIDTYNNHAHKVFRDFQKESLAFNKTKQRFLDEFEVLAGFRKALNGQSSNPQSELKLVRLEQLQESNTRLLNKLQGAVETPSQEGGKSDRVGKLLEDTSTDEEKQARADELVSVRGSEAHRKFLEMALKGGNSMLPPLNVGLSTMRTNEEPVRQFIHRAKNLFETLNPVPTSMIAFCKLQMGLITTAWWDSLKLTNSHPLWTDWDRFQKFLLVALLPLDADKKIHDQFQITKYEGSFESWKAKLDELAALNHNTNELWEITPKALWSHIYQNAPADMVREFDRLHYNSLTPHHDLVKAANAIEQSGVLKKAESASSPAYSSLHSLANSRPTGGSLFEVADNNTQSDTSFDELFAVASTETRDEHDMLAAVANQNSYKMQQARVPFEAAKRGAERYANAKTVCYTCGQEGHFSFNCPQKDTSFTKWPERSRMNKPPSNFQRGKQYLRSPKPTPFRGRPRFLSGNKSQPLYAIAEEEYDEFIDHGSKDIVYVMTDDGLFLTA